MNDWFIWNGMNCKQYGIYVSEQPPITIPSERATYTNVPGSPRQPDDAGGRGTFMTIWC